MTHTEQWFSKNYVMPMLQELGEAIRIETSTISGVPDIFAASRGQGCWIETKVVRLKEIYFEKFQLAMITRLSRHFPVYVIATDWENFYVYQSDIVLQAPRYLYNGRLHIKVEDLSPIISEAKPWSKVDLQKLFIQAEKSSVQNEYLAL
jgi:Holliday junction resolvase